MKNMFTLKAEEAMTGIQHLTDEEGRKVAGGPDFDLSGVTQEGVPRPLRFLQRAGIHAVYAIEHGSYRVISERNHFLAPSL